MPAGKVEVAPVRDVERSGFVNQLGEHVHVVDAARDDSDHGGKVGGKLSPVWRLMAALRRRQAAHGKNDRHQSMVVESGA